MVELLYNMDQYVLHTNDTPAKSQIIFQAFQLKIEGRESWRDENLYSVHH